MSRCQDVKMGKTNSFSDVVMGTLVMGTGTWVWVPVFMAIFLLYS